VVERIKHSLHFTRIVDGDIRGLLQTEAGCKLRTDIPMAQGYGIPVITMKVLVFFTKWDDTSSVDAKFAFFNETECGLLSRQGVFLRGEVDVDTTTYQSPSEQG